VSEKSNEIAAIPALLDMLAIEGAILTIDALGCQRDIASLFGLHLVCAR
jgi:predicted transposase YbfD/YdcC